MHPFARIAEHLFDFVGDQSRVHNDRTGVRGGKAALLQGEKMEIFERNFPHKHMEEGIVFRPSPHPRSVDTVTRAVTISREQALKAEEKSVPRSAPLLDRLGEAPDRAAGQNFLLKTLSRALRPGFVGDQNHSPSALLRFRGETQEKFFRAAGGGKSAPHQRDGQSRGL